MLSSCPHLLRLHPTPIATIRRHFRAARDSNTSPPCSRDASTRESGKQILDALNLDCDEPHGEERGKPSALENTQDRPEEESSSALVLCDAPGSQCSICGYTLEDEDKVITTSTRGDGIEVGTILVCTVLCCSLVHTAFT